MNEIFEKFKSENIPLAGGYFLRPDGFRGLVLVKETEKIAREKRWNKGKIHSHRIYLSTNN